EEIGARRCSLRSDIDSLEQIEDPTEDDHVRLDGLLSRWDDLTVELRPLEEREQRGGAVRWQPRQPANNEPTEVDAPEVITRTRRDPFEDLDAVRTGVAPAADI